MGNPDSTDFNALIACFSPTPKPPGTIDWQQHATWISSAPLQQVTKYLTAFAAGLSKQPLLDCRGWEQVLGQLIPRFQQADMLHDSNDDLLSTLLSTLLNLDRHTHAASPCRQHLLLAAARLVPHQSLTAFAEHLASHPTSDAQPAAVAIGVLMGRKLDLNQLFPALLAGIEDRVMAAPILDLTNYLVRSRSTATHPAIDLRHQLTKLLDGLATRLQELPPPDPAVTTERRQELAKFVDDTIALGISLCDALALMEHHEAIPALHKVMELPHRRLRAEAAAAATRLGDSRAKVTLLELAKEPTVRQRVIQYCEELAIDGELDPLYLTPTARGEAELTNLLSHAEYFGQPPTNIELITWQEMYWPGFASPVNCCLYRFRYVGPDSKIAGVGMAGPTTHIFVGAYDDLSEEDLFALFAGWYAEHDEISVGEISPDQPQLQPILKRLEIPVAEIGYEDFLPRLLGNFFGERCFIGQARKDQTTSPVAVDSQRAEAYPYDALSPHETFYLYAGRRLLRSFNE